MHEIRNFFPYGNYCLPARAFPEQLPREQCQKRPSSVKRDLPARAFPEQLPREHCAA